MHSLNKYLIHINTGFQQIDFCDKNANDMPAFNLAEKSYNKLFTTATAFNYFQNYLECNFSKQNKKNNT